MQKNLIRLFVISIAVVLLSACEASTNYSQLLKQEQELIDTYLERNGYSVLEKFPEDSIFGEKEMYRYPDGIYIRLIDKGEGDTIPRGGQFTLRYRQMTLDEYPIIEDYWTTLDRPYPNTITMGSLVSSCEGWQAAFDVMKRSNSHAEIVVPSKLGRNLQLVVPYHYEVKIKALPK